MRERVTGEHVDRVHARLFEPAADLDRVFDRVAFRSHGKKALPYSVADILTWRWKSGPTSARIARTTSSSSRARFSSDPP